MNLKTTQPKELSLKSLNDLRLMEKTESLVREERELLSKVLHHLREIERRRLFSALGYKSLFDMAVRKFGYSEDQAYRRISAMRLLKELPEMEEKINSGELSLTHIGIAQSLFRQEKKTHQAEMSRDQKITVLESMVHKPVREAERIVLSFSSAPELAKPDRVNVLSEDRIELKLTASTSLQEKIEKLKGILAHQHPNLSLGELFEKLCDLGLQEWDPVSPGSSRKRRVTKSMSTAQIPDPVLNKNEPQHRVLRKDEAQPQALRKAGNRCEVLNEGEMKRPALNKAQIRREVFRKAGNRCSRCGSLHALEVDHIQPKALSGSSDAANLRLLCRSCNQRAAIEVFGIRKMERYLNEGLT